MTERVQALLGQAAALERSGAWPEAALLYSQLFSDAIRAGNLAAAVDACRREGWIRGGQGQSEEAAEMVELSLTLAELNGMGRAAARASNALAGLFHQQGYLDSARQLYEEALTRAREEGDDELIGSACLNLGVVATVQGALAEARGLYLESIGSAVRCGSRVGAMWAYNNLGMLYADLHEWLEAEVYFSRGIEIAEQLGDAAVQAKLYVNRVEPLIQFGELPRARSVLLRAEEIAGHLNDDRVLCDVERFRGVICRVEGDWPGADRHLQRALEIAQTRGFELERAEVLEEVARLRWAEGRAGPARLVLREARRLYLALDAGNDLERVEALLESWSGSTQDPPPTSTGTPPAKG